MRCQARVDESPYQIKTCPLICTPNQWTSFYMIGTSVMKELMNCVFPSEMKWNDNLLELKLVLISNYSATVSTHKNCANLIYANQFKKRICRLIISVSHKPKHKKQNVMKVTSSLNYTVTELHDVIQKEEPHIFIYKSMTLTLKLFSRSSSSTKMPFLSANRTTVIRGRIVTPHTRLHVEP